MGIMHSTRPACIDINEKVSMVNSPLQDNGVPAFMIVVIGWTLLWRNDGDVGFIYSSSTLGKAKVIPETINDLYRKQLLLETWYNEAVEI